MFSGIVEALGTLRDVEDRETTRRFRVEAPAIVSELGLGDSVSVDGACLTVTDLDDTSFAVDVIEALDLHGREAPGAELVLDRESRDERDA